MVESDSNQWIGAVAILSGQRKEQKRSNSYLGMICGILLEKKQVKNYKQFINFTYSKWIKLILLNGKATL